MKENRIITVNNTQPLLIFGGSYSNLEALQALQGFAKDNNFISDQIICTGDVVGYCANPEESVQLVKEWGIHVIAGNVELQLREGAEDCGCDFDSGSRCDVFSRQWYPFAQKQISEDSMAYLHSLPDHLQFSWADRQWAVVHGNAFETAGYVFKSTPWSSKAKSLKEMGADAIIAGHCGLPFANILEEKAWINPGVIGMPANDGKTKVWFAILSPESPFAPSYHRLEFDHTAAASKMRSFGLPEAYAKTLENGLWDNMDILPEVEREQQGFPLFPNT